MFFFLKTFDRSYTEYSSQKKWLPSNPGGDAASPRQRQCSGMQLPGYKRPLYFQVHLIVKRSHLFATIHDTQNIIGHLTKKDLNLIDD